MMHDVGPITGFSWNCFCCAPIALIGLLLSVLWVWMLIDVLTNEPSEGNDKVIWVLVIILTGGIGALIYYFVRRPERIRRYGK